MKECGGMGIVDSRGMGDDGGGYRGNAKLGFEDMTGGGGV